MRIRTNIKNFLPKNFAVHNFYGIDTCFVWNSNNQIIIFPYIYDDSTVVSKVLETPAKVKDVRGFDGRVYVLCSPHGIYKVTEKFEFATLSKTGLEIISKFCVLTLNDKTIFLVNKTSEKIVKLLSFNNAIDTIYVLSLNLNSIDNAFCRALSISEIDSDVTNFCFLAVNNKLFKLVNKTVQLIYEADYSIKYIVAFELQNRVFGALLQTHSNYVILIHAVEKKLIYNKIFLNVRVQTICSIPCTLNKNTALIVYSDNQKTYYSKLTLSTNSVEEIMSENQIYFSIRLCQSNLIICLDDCSNLFQFTVDEIRNICEKNTSDYLKLQSNMLKGLDNMIDHMCEKTQELKILREDMLQKEDCLKRINIFINKQTIKYCPNDIVLRLYNHLFLISHFQKNLLENSTVVRVLKSRGKTIFLMKDVHDYDTVVEMPINLQNLSSRLCTTTDLISYKSDSGIWCLIKNYVQDPLPTKSNKTVSSSDKFNTVKYNLVVLKNLIKENKHNMESLSEIKRRIRHAIEL